MSRKPFIAGNWKMFKTRPDAKSIVEDLKPLVQDCAGKVDVAVCPPFTALDTVGAALAGSDIGLGAQNCHIGVGKDGEHVTEGAYTGEISPLFLKEIGCRYVILGHSERRQYFGETDAGVNQKAKALQTAGLIPIICVGETLDQRDHEQTLEVVALQSKGCLTGLPDSFAREIVLAYEPVWAIGTGRTATPEQAQEVHAHIRKTLEGLYGADTAAAIRIQYGGSVKPNNAKELFSQTDIDGGLIGGASLKAQDFSAIIHAATA